MKASKRNCVFVALSNAVGHELTFSYYTSKVVVGKYPDKSNSIFNTTKKSGRVKRKF